VTGVTHSTADGQPGSETINLAFAKIDVQYMPQKADGALDAGVSFKYDLVAHKIV
jgi:type VI secretion system secreted protein Hcp